MYLEILFLLLFLILYFLIYIELKINKENGITFFNEELTRNNIHKETYVKLPFLFDGKHLNETIQKSSLQLIEKKKAFTKYNKEYTPIKLLEPYTRCSINNYVYEINSKRNLPLIENNESINYYVIKSGKAKIALVHPKYKDNYQKKEKDFVRFIKDHAYIPFIECHENTILFVPNDWMIYIENDESEMLVLENIHYQTLINQLIQNVKKNLMTNKAI